jgi:hypothetical protein
MGFDQRTLFGIFLVKLLVASGLSFLGKGSCVTEVLGSFLINHP